MSELSEEWGMVCERSVGRWGDHLGEYLEGRRPATAFGREASRPGMVNLLGTWIDSSEISLAVCGHPAVVRAWMTRGPGDDASRLWVVPHGAEERDGARFIEEIREHLLDGLGILADPTLIVLVAGAGPGAPH